MKSHMIFDTSTQHFIYDKYYVFKYYIIKIHYNLKQHLKSRDKETVVIYQMGKVGSTTVLNSLRSLKNIDVYHVHALTEEGINKVEEMYRKSFCRTRNIYEHLLESQYLRKQLDRGLEGKKKWKFVTLIRDPIAKNISSFFQSLESRIGYEYKSKLDFMKTEDIVKELVELFLKRMNGYEKSLTWFERELNPVVGIDVFSKEFPQEKGYEIYKAEYADLLIIRLENLNECASDAFKKFLGINEFSLLASNVGSDKSYRDIYRGFLDSIVLPESYIDKMYAAKYIQHFYSAEEIEAFKIKWRRKVSA